LNPDCRVRMISRHGRDMNFGPGCANANIELSGVFDNVAFNPQGLPRVICVSGTVRALKLTDQSGRIGRAVVSTPPFKLKVEQGSTIEDITGCAYADIKEVTSYKTHQQFARLHAKHDHLHALYLATEIQKHNPQMVAFALWLDDANRK